MRRYLGPAFVTMIALLAVLQLVRPARTNPPGDPVRALQSQLDPSHPARAVIDRACQNCHSNETSWPWYSGVAPVSWLIAHDVAEARSAVNFSDWAAYSVETRRKMLKESCDEVREGEMPMALYRLVHPDAKLSAADVHAICSLSPMD